METVNLLLLLFKESNMENILCHQEMSIKDKKMTILQVTVSLLYIYLFI